MSYQVIARKYRPGKFADITAQEHITATIQNALRLDRVGHGYIFSGLRGVGKTTAARVFAKAVNCQRMISDPDYRREVTEPCGECESCRDFDAGTSLNISEFDAASNNSVDDIRQLRDNVRYGPQKGRYRVYIIDEVHMLSTAAFNAFLKTLEEPPPHAIFIFATTELHKIPATISSRCQRFNFKRIPLAAIEHQLQGIAAAEGIDVTPETLQLIARKAQGSMRDAQSIFDQVIAFSIGADGASGIEYAKAAELLNYIDDDHFFQVSDAAAADDPASMLQVARFIIDNGYDEQDFLEKLIEHFRNFLVLHNLRSPRLIERTEAVKERYRQSAGQFTPDELMDIVEQLMRARQELKFQYEYQFRFELTLLGLCRIKKKAPDVQLSAGTPASKQTARASRPREKSQRAVVPKQETAAPKASRTVVAPQPSKPAPPPRSLQEPSVQGVPSPPPPAAMPQVDFTAWQKKLSNFTRKQKDRPLEVPAAGAPGTGTPRSVYEGVLEVEKFRTEWKQFLDSLLSKGLRVLVTHLQSCELAGCEKGTLVISCGRRFSYEELSADAALLSSEVAEFYGIPVRLSIRYDADRDHSTREQTIFTLYRELSEKNEVVKTIIREFGGELVY
ncbi:MULTISPECIES: DNA polymerase III subunit gamma/tau [Prosthecochloris]|uniref:DNA polymerase III subunit gamma/tau n=1 Tax=Prosthecochloris vibrioformis TaxID=1098 RepID=A0A5C4S1M6_PROVB|nr:MULTISPECIES: DNA polymerase III subunit gamma/tau [Prosthecochloris]ANT64523.1 DNA polymerase III subunit gamma/tau [Prosthecochloris sp. CIB 2401]TNJ37360.1 DNA polymerase III subunit gamma/tau [Prosthecochloris vibrioformis]